jgi:PAS domain S-box-containing protein
VVTPPNDTAARLELLRRVAELANAAETVADAAAGCIDLVRAFTGWPAGHLFEVDLVTNRLVSSGVWRVDDPDRYETLRVATAACTFGPGEGLPGTVLVDGAPATTGDVTTYGNFPRLEAAVACGILGAFAFPVWVRDEVAGVIEFFSPDDAAPDAAVAELLEQVGQQLGRVVERQRHAVALAASEEHARRVVEAASGAYVSIDDAGTITAWNAAAESTFGWSREEAIGRPLRETIIPVRYRAAHQAGITRFVQSGEGPLLNRRTEIAALHRNGHELPVELGIWAVDEGGGRWSFNAFLHDITERRVAERELQAAYDRERDMVSQLTQLDRNKADFMSMVSHELRTPLTSIIGYLGLLEAGHGGPLTEQQQQMLDVVDRNAHRLLELIEAIVTLDRLESGRAPVEPVPVSVATLVEQVVAAVTPMAVARDQRLTSAVDDGAGEVLGDQSQLERVLLNLATNAVKFTPNGGTVEVSAAGTPDDEHVSITVTDTGMGVPADEQPRLFTRFFRSSAARAAAVPGTGLGLVIARSIIEAHGGTIEVESTEGEGTTVTVTLPRTPPAAAA